MIELFNLEKSVKTLPSMILRNLLWLNGYYMRTMDLEALVEKTIPFFDKRGYYIVTNIFSGKEKG